MKRAPVIPRHTTHTQSTEDTSSPAPAAPMVDSLIARVVLWPAVMQSLFR
jgi:ParB family chromosome partitioning protein